MILSAFVLPALRGRPVGGAYSLQVGLPTASHTRRIKCMAVDNFLEKAKVVIPPHSVEIMDIYLPFCSPFSFFDTKTTPTAAHPQHKQLYVYVRPAAGELQEEGAPCESDPVVLALPHGFFLEQASAADSNRAQKCRIGQQS